jgi:hypothetical protein
MIHLPFEVMVASDGCRYSKLDGLQPARVT